jgi:PHD/YefM family antitoxin component YafN of YafNO toxin-antitoxin module
LRGYMIFIPSNTWSLSSENDVVVVDGLKGSMLGLRLPYYIQFQRWKNEVKQDVCTDRAIILIVNVLGHGNAITIHAEAYERLRARDVTLSVYVLCPSRLRIASSIV